MDPIPSPLHKPSGLKFLPQLTAYIDMRIISAILPGKVITAELGKVSATDGIIYHAHFYDVFMVSAFPLVNHYQAILACSSWAVK